MTYRMIRSPRKQYYRAVFGGDNTWKKGKEGRRGQPKTSDQ